MEERVVSPAELVQGSPEWHAARLGKVTASCFGKVMTPSRSKGEGLSQTSLGYMTKLIGERLSGVPADELNNKYVAWGHEHEPIAREMYEWDLEGNHAIHRVGFCVHPKYEDVGYSPDAFVDDDGLVEIKCPYNVENHLAVLEGDLIADKDYQWQCQGGLWVTGRKWLDYVSFHPLMPEKLRMHVIRIERNEDMIEDLEAAVTRFLDQMHIRLSKIRKAVDLV